MKFPRLGHQTLSEISPTLTGEGCELNIMWRESGKEDDVGKGCVAHQLD